MPAARRAANRCFEREEESTGLTRGHELNGSADGSERSKTAGVPSTQALDPTVIQRFRSAGMILSSFGVIWRKS
jgi:hypothetical protein